ncbi:Uncharacterised protein [Mannheimia haemolytica]|uniref:Uncharacterized protein n=1 Tax=Mannheimia haemolytica TaxID=75985 RepID=A0A448T4C1_MANHA|nr:hypothetical protein [Mannheimia haemolytica]VEI74844.1 Uncharacterised protein [Mannheimia haemolytica]
MYYIFDKSGNFIANSDFEPNLEDLAERGEQAVENAEILTNPILINGKIIDKGIAPSHYHVWSGKNWVLPKAQQQAVISAEKSAKLEEINRKAQDFINDLAKYNETPSFERDTWLEQAKEAKAWVADPTTQTPTLALIAQMRGVPIDTLRQKAYEKAMAYQTVAAIVAGQRQAYEDRLNAAENLEQIQAIKPVYQLPQGGQNE